MREVLDRGLDRIPTYGKLSDQSLDAIKDLLGALADQGLLERRGIEGGRPGAFVLALTPESPGKAEVALRVRLQQTQKLVAVAEMNDGTLYTASREVKVTIGGCGG